MAVQHAHQAPTFHHYVTGVALAKKTGTLHCTRTEDRDLMPNPSYGSMTFVEGNVIAANVRNQGHDLLTMLNKYGLLSEIRMENFMLSYPLSGEKALALLLLGSRFVTRDEIDHVLRLRIATSMYALDTIEEGNFWFSEGERSLPETVATWVNFNDVIKMRQSATHLYHYRPELAVIVKLLPSARDYDTHMFSPMEWQVFGRIDNATTALGIARELHLGDLEIRQVLYTFEQANLIEFEEPRLKSKQMSKRIETREFR